MAWRMNTPPDYDGGPTNDSSLVAAINANEDVRAAVEQTLRMWEQEPCDQWRVGDVEKAFRTVRANALWSRCPWPSMQRLQLGCDEVYRAARAAGWESSEPKGEVSDG